MKKKCVCYVLCLTVWTLPSWGWSRKGHQLIAAIAAQHITPNTAHVVDALLQHQSMVDVSDWADRIRRSRRYLTWHYATLSQPNAPLTNHEGQLYGAIYNCLHVLNPRAKHSDQERKTALKLLIHLVADAHQPLHVGNGQDKGGNLCRVRWFSRKKPVNFHKIWDDFLVKSLLVNTPYLVAESKHLPQQQITMWQSTPIAQWFVESRSLHARIYPHTSSPFCQRFPKKLKPQTLPHLGKTYVTQMTPIVKKRLLQGGLRLAYLLNQTLDVDLYTRYPSAMGISKPNITH